MKIMGDPPDGSFACLYSHEIAPVYYVIHMMDKNIQLIHHDANLLLSATVWKPGELNFYYEPDPTKIILFMTKCDEYLKKLINKHNLKILENE